MSNKIVSAQPALAVVGVSALFPGSLEVGGFWRDIFAGRDLLTDVPSTHWLLDDFYDANPKAPDKTYAKRGGFLRDVPFDPMAFGVPPSILEATDTSQLLALIVAQRVLEDATRGQFAQMDKSRVSVVLGVTSGQELMGSMVGRLQRPVWQKALREAGLPESKVQEACERISKHYVPWQESSFPGLLGNVVAGRIANRFDLGGTNCVTDAACASAFSAVAMAAHELHLGLSDMVIAGGVDTMNDIFMFMCFSKTPALSPSGDCRPFSDQADGTMLGEGLGMIALKRLEDAERDGDAIYAVLRGIGSSSDGRAKSVYAPVPEGQAKALRRAYEQAGYGPETVELVEAHGTGTKAGDAAEFEGLRQAFDGSGREDRQWCALGSVKSQIGHTKSAAGVAGLIKALFALRHKVLPPTIKVERPNPKLELERSPFYLNTEARPWVRPGDHPRRASVSSFGFGGSNFHLTLEEYAGHAPLAGRHRNGGAELVVLGASDAGGLLAQVSELAAAVGGEGFLAWLARDSQAKASAWAFEDKAFFEGEKPNLRRVKKEGGALPAARLAVWAEDEDDLRAKLAQAAARLGKAPSEGFALPGLDYALGAEAGEVALLFPGQGSQYLGMGAGVAMGWDRAAQVWDEVASLGWPQGERLDQVVFPRPSFSEQEREANKARVVRTEWAQPGIGAASLALLALLRRAGVGYDRVGGHSFGEVIALSAAGVLGPLDAMRVARKRGELMRDAAASTSGAMSAVVATVEQVREVLAQAQVGAKVANHNAPQQVVISGPTAQVEAAEVALQARGLRVKRLSVATAFHSEVVSASSEPFGAFLQGVEFGAARVPVYANSEAAPYSADAGAMRATLAGQIARPVRFVEQVEAMYAAGARTFIEVGPSAVLTGLVGSILGARPHKAVALDRQGTDGAQVFLQGLGKLWVGGVAVDFEPLWGGFVQPVDPRTLPKPKMVVPINGSNYNKPYPPPGGASALPGPNPEVEPEVVVREVIHEVVREVVKEVPVAVYTPSPAPVTGAEAAGSSQAPAPATPSAQVAASPAPVGALAVTMSDPERLAWVGAFQEAQRQTAEVHASWQATMAQTHMAWLRSMETSFVGLSALVGGPVAAQPAPFVAAAPVAAPSFAPRAVAPAPVAAAPVMAAPVAVTPAPVVAPKPAPAPVMAAAPVAAPPAPVVAPKPAPVVVAPVVASAGVDLQRLMLEVVSEKTGYPAEMLDLKMSLEADLGIDSIKRVEILSAMTERAPGLPEVDTSKMASLKTLGQIVEVMQAAGAGAVKPSNGKAGSAPVVAPKPAPVAAPAVVASAGVDLQKLMLEVVSEKTGYPAEMLDLKMSLEADLGIDSIKRVEILSAMTERAPGLPEVDTSKMASLKTLGQIVEVMQAASGGAPAKVEAQAQGGKSFLAEADPRLGRYVLDAVEAPALGFAVSGLVAGRVVVTSQGCEGVAEALVGELARFGVKAEAAATVPGDAEAVVFLGGLADGLEEPGAALRVQRSAFEAAKAVAGGFEAGRGVAFVTVQDTGGDFGLSGSPRAWLGGLPGLVKTAAQEWPRATCKALDVERGGRSAQELARVIAQELMAGGPEPEVGLKADGRRLALKSHKKAVEGGAPAAGPGSVIVVSGGARGVTAATVVALAREARSKFVILGRTALGEEPAACRGVEGDAALKRALLEDTRARGVALNPAQLGEQVAAILANREVRATLAAIEAAGAQVRYVVADVADAASVKAGLAQVRQGWGPITGLVHGAGVLADRKIADKTLEQFDKVLRTKVGGLQALLEATQADPLSLIVMFSSVAGRAGNVGQCDYAMANETLNKVAGLEAARRGSACLVKSLGWGPWEGGMVTPALKARFEALGVALIPLKVGAQMLVDEVMRSDRGRVELVLGGPPKGEALLSSGASAPQAVFELGVDPSRCAFLADHSIQGVPVVPAVLVLEWFARAAKAMRPELSLVACRDLKVLQGIQLKHFGAGERFFVHAQAQDQGDKATLALDVRDVQGHIRYTGAADLQAHAPTSSARLQAPTLAAWDASKRLYGDVLFHGPDFQVIRAIEGFAQEGIVGLLDGVEAKGWGGAWRTDSAALDGGLQLAVLWAREVLGGRSLPTRLVSYRPSFGDALPQGPLRCVVRAKAQGASKVVCDLAFADPQGRLVVELQAELHVMPGQQLVW